MENLIKQKQGFIRYLKKLISYDEQYVQTLMEADFFPNNRTLVSEIIYTIKERNVIRKKAVKKVIVATTVQDMIEVLEDLERKN